MISVIISSLPLISILLFPSGLILLFISQLKEGQAHTYPDYKEKMPAFTRPWGLKIKELKAVHDETDDSRLKSIIQSVIMMRKLGFKMMIATPLLLLVALILLSN